MSANALYVYGVTKAEPNLKWKEMGLNRENVYTTNEGKFSALVHDCEEKPYISEDPNKIKELILAHNKILDRAMKDFEGVIPLHFNTIIRKGGNSPQYNLKKWLSDNKGRLEKIWNKVKGKKEYGIRIYYEKNNLVQEAYSDTGIKEIEESQQGKSKGLSYLLQGKVESKINEIIQNRINQSKQKFYSDIKKITDNIKVNIPRISIKEEKNLLLSLSILVDEQEITKVKQILEEEMGKDFSFQLVGPFAPYSFVDNETKS